MTQQRYVVEICKYVMQFRFCVSQTSSLVHRGALKDPQVGLPVIVSVSQRKKNHDDS